MKSGFLKTATRPIAEINIVPYVDVMLVLLVIFMVTAPLLSQGVEVDLPQTQAKALPQKSKPPIVVTVSAVGDLYLNISDQPNQAVLPKRLQIQVAASTRADPTRAVIVRGDKSVLYDKILDAMVLLQKAGVERVGLETKHIESDVSS